VTRAKAAKPTPLVCRNGHPRIPENRTTADKCKVCATVRRELASEANRQAKRLKKERERTVVNRALRNNKSLTDDGPLEHLRASRIFGLMDSFERATSRAQRQAIQSAIKELT
jgi:hypothetical protein